MMLLCMAMKFLDPGLPESFNVLIKELQSLGVQADLCKVGKRRNVSE